MAFLQENCIFQLRDVGKKCINLINQQLFVISLQISGAP